MIKEQVSFRRVFCAPRDMVWVSADFKSQELRIAAAISGDKNLNAVYNLEDEYTRGTRPLPLDPEGNTYADPRVDPHIMASTSMSAEVKNLVLNEPWKANESNKLIKTYRKKGKVLNFQILYGGQANAIASALSVSNEEAEKLISDYFSYPDGFYDLGKCLKKTGLLGNAQRWVRTPMGGMLFCNESNAKGLINQNTSIRRACNFIIQGTAAEQCKLALIYVDEVIEELNLKFNVSDRPGRIVAVVHDEINAIVPGKWGWNKKIDNDRVTYKFNQQPSEDSEEIMAYEYATAIKEAMEKAMAESFRYCSYPTPAGASIQIGRYWLH